MSSNTFARLLTGTASVAGTVVICQAVYQFIRFLQFNLRSSALPKYGRLHRLHSSGSGMKSNPWALVTGASDGLGIVFAEQLAAKGFNLIVHGRNQKKLDGIKADLELKYKIHVRTLVIDAEKQPAAFDEKSYRNFEQTVLSAIEDVPLTILVNNIGVIGQWLSVDN